MGRRTITIQHWLHPERPPDNAGKNVILSFCQSSLECCTYTPFSNHVHSSSQVTHSSIPSSPVGYVSSRTNTFSIAAMLQSTLSLSITAYI